MKKIVIIVVVTITTLSASAQGFKTRFLKTNEQFKNGKFVWEVSDTYTGRVGEFWPISAVNLVTNTTNPELFNGASIDSIQSKFAGVATSPDGMTGGSIGNYQLQGKCLASGKPCGDGNLYEYGIVVYLPKNQGHKLVFTHLNEFTDFQQSYNQYEKDGATLFFLPSIYRNGDSLVSEKLIEKVLIRRSTVGNTEQVGVIVFDQAVTCNQARQIVLGLDRPGKSTTTHIYVLDGGPIWGQACKETNNTIEIIGTRDESAVTNYLVFY